MEQISFDEDFKFQKAVTIIETASFMIGMPWTTRALSDLSFRHCVSTQFQNS
jgi:hypothetical protein